MSKTYKVPFSLCIAIGDDDVITFASILDQYKFDINAKLENLNIIDYPKDDKLYKKYNIYDSDSCLLDIDHDYPEWLIDVCISRKAYKICKYLIKQKVELTSWAFGSLRYAIATNSPKMIDLIYKAYEGDSEVWDQTLIGAMASNGNYKMFKYYTEKRGIIPDKRCVIENAMWGGNLKIIKLLHDKYGINGSDNMKWALGTTADDGYTDVYKWFVKTFCYSKRHLFYAIIIACIYNLRIDILKLIKLCQKRGLTFNYKVPTYNPLIFYLLHTQAKNSEKAIYYLLKQYPRYLNKSKDKYGRTFIDVLFRGLVYKDRYSIERKLWIDFMRKGILNKDNTKVSSNIPDDDGNYDRDPNVIEE